MNMDYYGSLIIAKTELGLVTPIKDVYDFLNSQKRGEIISWKFSNPKVKEIEKISQVQDISKEHYLMRFYSYKKLFETCLELRGEAISVDLKNMFGVQVPFIESLGNHPNIYFNSNCPLGPPFEIAYVKNLTSGIGNIRNLWEKEGLSHPSITDLLDKLESSNIAK
jgi:hypothetical protein